MGKFSALSPQQCISFHLLFQSPTCFYDPFKGGGTDADLLYMALDSRQGQTSRHLSPVREAPGRGRTTLQGISKPSKFPKTK